MITVEKLDYIFKIMAVISLPFAFVSGVGSFFTSGIISKKMDQNLSTKDEKINNLTKELSEEKNKIRSLEIEYFIEFSVPYWKNYKFHNDFAVTMKGFSYLQMYSGSKQVVFEQVQLPHFSVMANNRWMFRAKHVLVSSYPLYHSKEKLKDFKKLRISIPINYVPSNVKQILRIERVVIDVEMNGKDYKKIVDHPNSDFPISFLDPTNRNQGHAMFDLVLDENVGLYSKEE